MTTSASEPAWFPAGQSWTCERTDNGFVVRPRGHSADLNLGELPDRVRITVENRPRKALAVTATSSASAVLVIASPPGRLSVSARFSRIVILGSGFGVSTVTMSNAPTLLTVGGGQWTLEPPAEVEDLLRVRVEAASSDVSLTCGRLGELLGQARKITLPSDVEVDRIEVAADLRARRSCVAGTLVCEELEAEQTVRATELRCLRVTGRGVLDVTSANVEGQLQALRVTGGDIHLGDGPVEVEDLIRANGLTVSSAPGAQGRPQVSFRTGRLSLELQQGGAKALDLRRVDVEVDHLDSVGPRVIGLGRLFVKSDLSAEHSLLLAHDADVTNAVARLVRGDALTLRGLCRFSRIRTKSLTLEECRLTSRGVVDESLRVIGESRLLGEMTIHGDVNADVSQKKKSDRKQFELLRLIPRGGNDVTARLDIGEKLVVDARRARVNLVAVPRMEIVAVGDVTAELGQPDPTEDLRFVFPAREASLRIHAPNHDHGSVQLICDGPTSVETSGEGTVDLRLVEASAPLVVDSNCKTKVQCIGSPATLTLRGGGLIDLDGTIAGAEFRGVDLSVSVARACHIVSASGSSKFDRLDGWLGSPASDPLSVLAIESCGASARVHGVDVSKLSVEGIRQFEAAETFEPDASSIVKLATAEATDALEMRARAQWIAKLQEVLTTRAISGATKSRVSWSAARAHHRSLDSGGERTVRHVHRALGYGYKVWPPLLTWLAASALVAWASLARRYDWQLGIRLEDRMVSEAAGEFFASAFFPFRLLRLAPNTNVFSDLWPAIQPLCGLAVGLPFAFVVIAIRRFFALSVD